MISGFLHFYTAFTNLRVILQTLFRNSQHKKTIPIARTVFFVLQNDQPLYASLSQIR